MRDISGSSYAPDASDAWPDGVSSIEDASTGWTSYQADDGAVVAKETRISEPQRTASEVTPAVADAARILTL